MLFRLLWALFANVVLNLLVAPLWLLSRLRRPRRVLLRLEGAIPEHPPASPWWRRYRGASVEQVCDLVDAIIAEPKARGLVLVLGRLQVGLATLESLRLALAKLREAEGKELVVHLEDVGTRELVLAAGADRIFIAEGALLDLRGLALELGFYGGALARLGVEVETLQTGPYKNAGERLTRESISAAQREALDRFLDVVYGRLVAQIAAGRGLSEEQVRGLIDAGPYDGDQAVALGLCDASVPREGLLRLLAALDQGAGLAESVSAELALLAHGQDADERKRPGREAPVMAPRAFLRRWRPRFRPFWAPKVIAVVPLEGAIHGGQGGGLGASTIGDRSTRRLLAALARQRRVAAVVLHIDSRGGSASASDHIWAGVRDLAARKPVVGVMANVAASGGYYIASACDAIYATPQTITGSIGVIAARFSIDGLLRRLGVGTAVLGRGRRAALYGVRQPLSGDDEADDRRQAVHDIVAHAYERFLGRVSQSRGISRDEAHAVAQGRVWVGDDAHERGLVDGLGGLQQALDDAGRRAGLAKEAKTLVVHPPRRGLFQREEPSFASLVSKLPEPLGCLGALIASGDPVLYVSELHLDL